MAIDNLVELSYGMFLTIFTLQALILTSLRWLHLTKAHLLDTNDNVYKTLRGMFGTVFIESNEN